MFHYFYLCLFVCGSLLLVLLVLCVAARSRAFRWVWGYESSLVSPLQVMCLFYRSHLLVYWVTVFLPLIAWSSRGTLASQILFTTYCFLESVKWVPEKHGHNVCLCCHQTPMGSVLFFLSREMHKWTFLTPQKEAGPLCVHTRAGCRSPEEADMLSAGGQRAGEPEQRGHHSVLGSSSSSTTHSHTHTHTHTHVCAPTPPHTHTHKWVKNTRMLFREGKSLNIYVKK